MLKYSLLYDLLFFQVMNPSKTTNKQLSRKKKQLMPPRSGEELEKAIEMQPEGLCFDRSFASPYSATARAGGAQLPYSWQAPLLPL